MKRLLTFLTNPNVIKAIGFLVLIAIVLLFVTLAWWWKALIIGAIILLWVLIYFSEKQQATKNSAAIENALWSQADDQAINVKPAQKAEIEEIKEKFQQSIAALKASKLGKEKFGSSALYALPWYMIIGPPSVGKTTAIKESGLNIPVVDPRGEKQSVQGIGGTRNCDWWFTDEAILLDTAGRWASEAEEADREEWLSFLKFLKRYRGKKPINGVMVAVSVEEVMKFDEYQIEDQAHTIRNRIDELIQELGIIFPIYLVFTKSDLIRGFVEMFGDMSKTERSQIWGQTISLEQSASTKPGVIIENGIRELEQNLSAYRLTRLQKERKDDKRNVIFSFPMQFSLLAPKLNHFVETLFKKSAYKETPMLRGFYFTSGTQEGSPIDKLTEEISRQFGLGPIAPIFQEPGEKKSYFLTDLFKEVMIPDHNLAGLSSGGKFKRKIFTAGIFTAVVVLLGLFILAVSGSFVINKNYLGKFQTLAGNVAKINPNDGRVAQIKDNMRHLDGLRQEIITMAKATPIRQTFGMDVSGKLEAPARQLFYQKVEPFVLEPVKTAIQKLRGMYQLDVESDFENQYDIFKAYLMLGDSVHRAEPEFLTRKLAELYHYDNVEIQGLVNAQVEYYLAHIKDKKNPPPRLKSSPETISEIRRKLIMAQSPGAAGIYSKIKAEALQHADRLPDFNLGVALTGQSQSIVENNVTIPGMYTMEGWNTFVYDAIYKDEPPKEDWVLGTKSEAQDKESVARLRRQVADKYFDDYEDYWKSFLRATRIVEFQDLYSARKTLERLSMTEESPVYLILESIYENTNLPEDPHKVEIPGQATKILAKGKIGKIVKTASKFQGQKEEAADTPTMQLARRFRTVHELVGAATEGQEGPVMEYLGAIGDIYAKITTLESASQPDYEAAMFAKKVIESPGNELSQALDLIQKYTIGNDELKNILAQPVPYSWGVILQQAQRYLNDQWQAEVYEKFQDFNSSFPINTASTTDAPFSSIEEFFNPSGTFWSFYKNELAQFIDNRGGRWIAKSPAGGLQRGIGVSAQCQQAFQQADLITKSLFPQGTMRIDFDIKPILYTFEGTSPNIIETTLSFDGQELRYHNDVAEWKRFTWPGSFSSGARLIVRTRDSGLMPDNASEFRYEGPWALFRLLNAGQWSRKTNTNLIYTWQFSKQSQYRAKISFQFQSQSANNPFIKGLFSSFRCPNTIG